MVRTARLASTTSFLCLALGCSTAPPCDLEALRAALAAAAPGALVQVGACRFEGVSLVVPPGVTLEGDGASSVLAGTGPLVTLAEGAALRRVELEVDGGIGITARGATITVSDVELRVVRGVGVIVRGGRATLARVGIHGSATASLAPSAGPEVGSYGVAAIDGTTVELSDLEIDRGGPWGVIVDSSALTWRGGAVRETVGTAIYVANGSASLVDVRVEDVLQGLQPLPSCGLVATAGASIDATRLAVVGSEGLGVLVDASSGTFDALSVGDARYGGVWVQDSTGVVFTGIALARNGLAGLTAVASAIDVDGGTVESTTRELAIYGEVGAMSAGDGIALVRPSGATRISGVDVEGSARIGVLVDVAAGALASVTLVDVAVGGETLGCLAQEDGARVPLGGWDAGVTRSGAALANDGAQATPLAPLDPLASRNVPVAPVASLPSPP